MLPASLEFQGVTFIYDSAADPVFEQLSACFPRGWTGIIGANGSGKTTLLRLACGMLMPIHGRVIAPDRVIYCPQRTDDPPGELTAFVDATDRLACALRGQLGVLAEWVERWQTLSHGERKRAQIAVALWHEPRLLAIDEPTNHIDLHARQQLGHALSTFRGVGLLVSHDRALLDRLCRQCLMVESPSATIRPGGYTKATELAKAELQRRRTEREQARHELARLKREAAKRQQEAAASHKKRSKRGLAIKDHDAKFKINQARITGKDGKAGELYNQLQGRVQQASERLDRRSVPRQQRMGIRLTGERSRRDTLLRLPAQTIPLWHRPAFRDPWHRFQTGDTAVKCPAGAPPEASAEAPARPGQRTLAIPDLEITPDARIALTGPNGSGKSTLLRHITHELSLPPDRLIYLPQELPAAAADAALRDLHSLRSDAYGEMISTIARLGSDPERVMQAEHPSPGELRKILLARGLTKRPYLIIMDEPTNHLDLPSIECLESALQPADCALLLVSHDLPFLKRLCRTWWHIKCDADEATICRLTTSPHAPPN